MYIMSISISFVSDVEFLAFFEECMHPFFTSQHRLLRPCYFVYAFPLKDKKQQPAQQYTLLMAKAIVYDHRQLKAKSMPAVGDSSSNMSVLIVYFFNIELDFSVIQ